MNGQDGVASSIPAPLLRWWFRLVGSDGWGRGEVWLRARTAVQAPGQAIGVLASLPAAGLPSFLTCSFAYRDNGRATVLAGDRGLSIYI